MAIFRSGNFFFTLFILFLLLSIPAKAQDTLRINALQADSIFLENSFYLLASSMNIEAQKAEIIQAKLYPNPVLSAEFNAYDPENDIVFHAGKTGQKEFQIEQLILLGGKRKAEIEMAKTNASIAELEFLELTQNLRFQLMSSLYSVGQHEFLLKRYNEQLDLLDNLLSAYQTQVDKGNIGLKELVRLKGAYLKLNNDRAAIFREYSSAQAILQNILQVSSIIDFQFSEKDISSYITPLNVEELKISAAFNRPEFLIIQKGNLLSQQYLKYQKKLAVPDINVFSSYDQRGGVWQNEINAGIAIPLPLWNRNQGNIKIAEFKLQESDYQIKAMQNELNSEIQNAFANYLHVVAEYQKAITLYNDDFETTLKGMTDNFQKRNVSIIEFIDFFETYNEVLTELARIKTDLVSSSEELNLLVGKNIYQE